MSGPSGRPQVPPSKVRSLARSRDGEDLGLSKGPVLTRVQALPCAPRSGQRPAAAAWLVARDISQRVGPDVRPIMSRSLCIYCGEDAPPTTTLTSDVPSQHLIRPVQSAGRRVRVTQQTTRLSSLLTNSAPVLSGALSSSSLLREVSPAR
jgi:hypothetical protein